MFRKRTNKLLLSGVLLMSIFAFAGCNSTKRSGLVVAQKADAVSLDPHATNDSNSALVIGQIYDTLVVQDENMELHPGLAESWTKIDELTYEFKLKQNVYFHNGEELKASDVKFTLLRAIDSSHIGHIVDSIDPESIEVIDEYTIRLSTYEPYVPLLAHLAHTASSILNEKAVTEAGKKYGKDDIAVGTGPFTLDNWIIGDRVELSRNEDYHGDLAKVESLTIKTVTEASSRYIELETGEADIALEIAPADVERVKNNDNVTLLRERDLRTNYLGFNTTKEPFDNVKVRQAINYAIDVESIVNSVLEGVGAVASGPIGPNIWGAKLDLEAYPYNVEKAKELLAEAGYEDGFSTTIWTDSDGTRVGIATIIRNALEKIGIEAEIKQSEWGTYLAQTAEGKHDMFLLGWTTVTGDADYGLYALFHSSSFGEAGNRTFFSNKRVDELLDLARATTDESKREAYYHEIQEIIREEAPWVAINVGETVVGVQNNIDGFTINPNGHHKFKDVSLIEE